MLYQQSRSAYHFAAGAGATQAGLTQLVYTHLAQDLLHAAEAIRNGHIQVRCAASNHALMLLGHVESWSAELEDPGLAQSLRAFYTMLRICVLQSQTASDPLLLEESAQRVLEMRAVWQAKEESMRSAMCSSLAVPPLEPGTMSVVA